MKKYLIPGMMACVLGSAAGCAAEVETEQTLEFGSAEAGLEQPQKGRHCTVEAQSIPRGAPIPKDALTATPKCFDTFAASIAYATGGAVQLAADVKQEDVDLNALSKEAGLAQYWIGVEYIAPKHEHFWGYWNVYAANPCTTGDVFLNMPSGWDNTFSSSRSQAGQGCNHSIHYDNPYVGEPYNGGSNIDCGAPWSCYYENAMGAMNDRTSAIRWTY
jgi:hypothetical protein